MSQLHYDVMIAGAGLSGVFLALNLAEADFKVALIDKNPAPDFLDQAGQARRVSAITPKTQHLLKNIGVWDSIEAISPFLSMEVWDANSSGALHFDAGEIGLPYLGYILENKKIIKAMWAKLSQHPQIDLYLDANITHCSWDENKVLIPLSRKTLSANLLVGADGGHSRVRDFANIAVAEMPYQQQALVAEVVCERPHDLTARQRFLTSGPLAFLPLPDQYQCSIVWSCDALHIDHLKTMEPDLFNKTLSDALGHELGEVKLITTRAAFPLIKRHAKTYYANRVVLVGDAAHTIHPLAGLGANLGFLDDQVLCQTLKRALDKGRDIGAEDTLRRYQRERYGHNQLVMQAMDGFNYLFSHDTGPWVGLRALGMRGIAGLGFIRERIAKFAVGSS